MALTKLLNVTDELIFDLSAMREGCKKEISICFEWKKGNLQLFQIRADKSIPIKVFQQQIIPERREGTDSEETDKNDLRFRG
jgi:hypothetical protein